MLSPVFKSYEVVVRTRAVAHEMEESERFDAFVRISVDRFFNGDWGDVSDEDFRANDAALADGSRVLAEYKFRDFPKIWIIADAEDDTGMRTAITVLFPDEY